MLQISGVKTFFTVDDLSRVRRRGERMLTPQSAEVDIPVGIALRQTLAGHKGIIYDVAWSPDGTMLASASEDRTIRICDTGDWRLTGVLEGHSHWVRSISWMPTTDIPEHALPRWAESVRSDKKSELDVYKLASGSADKTVRIWSVANKSTLATLSVHRDDVRSVAWSPDGSILATGSYDSHICLWERLSEKSRSLRQHRGGILSLAWSPDSQVLASGSDDHTIALWDRATEQSHLLPRTHKNWVSSLSWSPDGELLASGSTDSTIVVWSRSRELPLMILEGHTGGIKCIRFSPDGRILASKSRDGTVRFWLRDGWKTLAILQEDTSRFRTSIAFHPREPTIATLGDNDQIIRIWHLDIDAMASAHMEKRPVSYRSAKVVLVGDTGVGKSGLGLVLTGQPFAATDSTHGRRVWTFASDEATLDDGRAETRETLLWDLAGQPGYRMTHQLHL
jgi:WD40 repeat protein